jgi:hypothetical protein
MSQLIGKKGSNLNPGYVWVPYLIVNCNPTVVESNFNPAMSISSRYSSTNIQTMINPKIKKIKKILENIEDFNVTLS